MILRLRDKIWNYPYDLFFGKSSVFANITELYSQSRPFSHILLSVILILAIVAGTYSRIPLVFGIDSNRFVEGLVVGTNASGLPRTPDKLNPLEATSPQLDKDVMALIYEPLIRINQDGEVEPVLAEVFDIDKESANLYRFKLRQDVYWHDEGKLTTEDVEQTFSLIKKLSTDGLEGVFAGEAAKNIEIEVLDDYVFTLEVTGDTIPNFYELITFPIVKAEFIDQYRDAILNSRFTGQIKLPTIGTGPYILDKIEQDKVIFTANPNYYLGSPKIENFEFKLIVDEKEGLQALRAGKIHAITNVSNNFIEEVDQLSNINLVSSNIIYNQYWGIYLDTRNTVRLKNSNIRKAIVQSINKEIIIKSIFINAEVANNTIPEISKFNEAKYNQVEFDLESAIKLIKDEGYKFETIEIDGDQIEIFSKDGELLEFNFYFVNNPDRLRVAQRIRGDLLAAGIKLNLQSLEPQELANRRDTQDYEMIMLGVSTFIDPDRFEFFHSSQTPLEGNSFNFSNYSSEEKTSIINSDREVERISVTDKLLDDARKTTEIEERQKNYSEFQKYLYEENPVVFLYHPSIQYAINKRVDNVELTQVKTLEDRFIGVQNWEINII